MNDNLDFSKRFVTGVGHICPHCHKCTDAAAGPEGEGPTAGCVSVCFHCGGISMFTADKTLRHLTQEEKDDKEMQAMLLPVIESVSRLRKIQEQIRNIPGIGIQWKVPDIWRK